jgi:hypothetical protein
MPGSGDLFQEWRAANRVAEAMEKEVVRASLRSVTEGAPEPLREAHEQAHKLRELANDLFKLAMDEMAQRAEAAKAIERS